MTVSTPAHTGWRVDGVHTAREVKRKAPLYTARDRDGRPVAQVFLSRKGSPYVSVMSPSWVCLIFLQSRPEAVRCANAIRAVLW